MKRFIGLMVGVLIGSASLFGGRPFQDCRYYSEVFKGPRMYRLFLPADYETSGKSYPVVYYFHGHSDRYTVESYDDGKVTVPRIAGFVADHDLIVVSVDGYVAEHYQGFYGGTPYDVRKPGGDYDFGEYFLELVRHIDGTYRTLTDRRHRGTSGLSMGGFMSLYLSARYPDVIGSASSFNPGPEFYVGDKGRRVLWRPKDHVSSLRGHWIRLIRASGDYISQYHEETRDAFARDHAVRFEYRRDEWHRHAATSIEETLQFHLRAFKESSLDNVPVEWSYSNPYRRFNVWGYDVGTEGEGAALVYLDQVNQGGMRLRTQQWAPDGPAAKGMKIHVKTAPLYKPRSEYQLLDWEIASGSTRRLAVTADEEGALELTVDGSGHQLGIVGPGTGSQPPVLLPVTAKDRLYLPPDQDVLLPIRVFNPRGEPLNDLRLALTSDYPTVQVLDGEARVDSLGVGETADLGKQFRVRFTAGTGDAAPTRLHFTMTFDGYHERVEEIDVAVIPVGLRTPEAVQVLDGRTYTFSVFRQAGNRGGGQAIQREVTEGKGNGNGILEPGEEATIWVRIGQGLDPFDKGNWYRCKLRGEPKWIEEVADLEEQKQLEWTSAMNRSSVIRLAPDVPAGTAIPLLLENESWSYTFTPDVRYGEQDLYQAFQLHQVHLHQYEIRVK